MKGHDLRSLDVAEAGSLDLYLGVALFRSVPDFAADMLAFAIAICPDDECAGTPCLVLDILGDVLAILSRFQYGRRMLLILRLRILQAESPFARARQTDGQVVGIPMTCSPGETRLR
jgi:hypothetical protein